MCISTFLSTFIANPSISLSCAAASVLLVSVSCPLHGSPKSRHPSFAQVTKSGALDIKILPRTSALQPSGALQGPLPEQEVPLQVSLRVRAPASMGTPMVRE